MHSASPAATAGTPRRRRLWPWILGLCLFPFVVVGFVAFSYLTLNRDAALLRRQVMAATQADWKTKVQLSVGGFTLGAVRTGLVFVHQKNIAEARLALAAVRHASVGVYERRSGPGECSREQLFVETDRAMHRRGWSRLVGVADDDGETVLIYAPEDCASGGTVDFCVAVLDGRDLVVVSATVEADALAGLVARLPGGDLRHRLKLARF